MTQVVLSATPPTTGNSYGKVWVDLIGAGGHPDGAINTADRTVVYRSITGRLPLSNTGTVIVDLDPPDTLTPAGLAYRASFQKTGTPTPETLIFGGFTGPGPVHATDWIVDPPGALEYVYSGGIFGDTDLPIETGGTL